MSNESKKVKVTLSFNKGVSVAEVIPVNCEVQNFIDENGLSPETFDDLSGLADGCKIYTAIADSGVLNVGEDEICDLGNLEITNMPIESDYLMDQYNCECNDSIYNSAEAYDTNPVFKNYVDKVLEKACANLDETRKELFVKLYKDESAPFILSDFLNQLVEVDKDGCNTFAMWLTNGECFSFEFIIGLEGNEEFDVKKLNLVRQELWDSEHEVFENVIDLQSYDVSPEWIMYDGRFIHFESAECWRPTCYESETVLATLDGNYLNVM